MLYPEHAKFIEENGVNIEDSLKIYFFSLSQLISILLPLSSNLKYRNTKAHFKQILIDEFVFFYNSNKASLSKTLMHNNNADERLRVNLPPKPPAATAIIIQSAVANLKSSFYHSFISDSY